MGPLLNIAKEAVLNAGKTVARFYDQLPKDSVTRKSDNTWVSKIDQEVEAAIIAELQSKYPNHGIICEESEAIAGDDYTWIIDPIDGTHNYIHALPYFCISLALQHKDRITHAVIYDPLHQELFSAARGKGAQLNNRRIRASSNTQVNDMFASVNLESLLKNPEILRALGGITDIRHTGSSALDLAYVAAGRLDAFWEKDLKIWDIAAGSLLVEEAGALISDWSGNPHYLKHDDCRILAANPKLFKQLLPLLNY